MPVTIQDVATAAGVSLATVSRALANSPRVKPDTRQRIQELAAKMGYAPSAIAQGLATKRTHTLGVVVRDIGDAFVAELVRSIDHQALTHGYTLLLSHCGDDPSRELAATHILRRQRVDGIIVADPSVPETFLPPASGSGTPAILINSQQYHYSVGTDNPSATEEAVNHLLSLGHRRIAYIGSLRNAPESRERQAGYERALRRFGITPDPTLVAEGEAGWEHAGWAHTERLLRLPAPPTAILCFNDLTAIGALGAAQAAGLAVPADLSLIGFDDISLTRYLNPPLTTVSQDREQLARVAVEMVLALLDGSEPPARHLVPGRLVLRASTCPPRQAAPASNSPRGRARG